MRQIIGVKDLINKNPPISVSDSRITQSIMLMPVNLLDDIDVSVLDSLSNDNCILVTDGCGNILGELSHNSELGSIKIT